MIVKSPITSGRVKLIKEISTKEIATIYQEGLDLDVKNYFEDVDQICLYKCLDTGYEFYYPFTINGNELFYKALEKNKWYYQKWKWEYQVSDTYVKEGQSVIEIGCGNGYFLSHLNKKKIYTLGLELNSEAIEKANKNGLQVLNTPLEVYSNKKEAKFDVVFAFQVLEHIWNINDFITQCIKLLKPNGKLIFAVPNNEAVFFKEQKILPKTNPRYVNQLQTLALNMPPHHMGLWRKKVFEKIPNFYSRLSLVKIYEEPANTGRIALNNCIVKSKIGKNKFLLKLYKKLNQNKLNKGDSLLVIYEKKG